MLDALRRIVLSAPVRIIAAVAAVWLLFAWFAVGPILKWAAPKYVAAHGERTLTIDRAHFNPFRLSLEIEGARLVEPDGAPLLAFERFLADFEIASIVRRAWSFREIVLDAPSTLVALREDGSLNWLDFISGFASDAPEPEKPDSGSLRLLVDRLAVTRGSADFSDRKFADGFETRIEPIDFEIRKLSTLPDEKGEHQLQLLTEAGAQLQWRGTLGLDPLVASGEVALSDLVFERLWPYLEPRLAMAPPRGTGEIRFDYRLRYEGGVVSMALDGIAATIRQLSMAGAEDTEPGIRIDNIALAGGRFDLQARSVDVESLDIGDGRIAVRRGADGAIDIASWFASPDGEGGEMSNGSNGESNGDDGSNGDGDGGVSAGASDEAPAAPMPQPTDDTSAVNASPGNSVSGTITPATGAVDARDDAWRFGIGRVGVDDIALHYVDEGFARPLTVDADKLRIGFELAGAAGGDDPQVQVDGLGIEVAGISLAAEGIAEPVLTLAGANLDAGSFDLAERSMAADALRLDGARLAAARAADGGIAVLDAFAPASGATTAGATGAGDEADAKPGDDGEPAAPWRYRLGEFRLDGGDVTLRDAAVDPAASLALQDVQVVVREISDDFAAQWPVEARFAVREGGSFEAGGFIVAGSPAGDLELRLADLGLAAAQPYLSEVARLRIVGGSLASAGRLRFGDGGFSYEGSADVRGLDLHELETEETLLGWKSLSTKNLAVRDDGVAIEELVLDGLRSKLIILEDRSVNVAHVVGPAEKEEQEELVATAEAKGAKPEPSSGEDPAFRIGVERLRLVDGDVDFADLSLALPFGTRIHELEGELAGLSNDPDSAATIALEGKVDEYGTAKAAGEINLFAPAEHTDAKVEFRNVEMTNLTPYTATFAGRHIASGTLSLDLEYRIEERQLRGDNRIVMEQLTLGEKVDSEEAPDLPLDLAVAILKDSQGRIDLGLPVSGSLEDPEFSFGAVVGKALLGLVTRIVTAPFRALGALFGGGDDVDMSQIAFDAGSAELPGREREKLAKLAEGLGSRPGLALEIEPGVNREVDGRALRDLQLRREIAGRLGRGVPDDEKPAPLAMSDGATRSALEALFTERFNAHELRQLRESPASQEPASDGQVGDITLGGDPAATPIVRDSVEPVKASDENDTYRRIAERLIDAEILDEGVLAALGEQRGEAIRAELEERGLDAGRMSIAQPAEREAEDQSVLVGLGLDARGAAGDAPADDGPAPAGEPPAAGALPG